MASHDTHSHGTFYSVLLLKIAARYRGFAAAKARVKLAQGELASPSRANFMRNLLYESIDLEDEEASPLEGPDNVKFFLAARAKIARDRGIKHMKTIRKRPKSARELSERARTESFDILIRDFLDAWYLSDDKLAMIKDEPDAVADERQMAYLTATCRQLALDCNLAAPAWCKGTRYQLKEPYFPCGLDDLRPILIRDSPPAFKMLNIFPGKNPLFRPSKLMDKDRNGSRYVPKGFGIA